MSIAYEFVFLFDIFIIKIPSQIIIIFICLLLLQEAKSISFDRDLYMHPHLNTFSPLSDGISTDGHIVLQLRSQSRSPLYFHGNILLLLEFQTGPNCQCWDHSYNNHILRCQGWCYWICLFFWNDFCDQHHIRQITGNEDKQIISFVHQLISSYIEELQSNVPMFRPFCAIVSQI